MIATNIHHIVKPSFHGICGGLAASPTPLYPTEIAVLQPLLFTLVGKSCVLTGPRAHAHDA